MTKYRVALYEVGVDFDVDSLDRKATNAVLTRHPALRQQIRRLHTALCMDRVYANVAVLDAADNIIEVIDPIFIERDW